MSNDTNEKEATDPLDGAAVGESAEIEATREVHFLDLEPDECWGTDRFSDYEVDVTVHDDRIKLHYNGEVTKRLPRRWDSDRWQQPSTLPSRGNSSRVSSVIGYGTAFAILLGISWLVMQELSSSLTINGQTVTAPSPSAFAMTVGIYVVAAAVVALGIRGGFPGGVGCRR